MSIIANYLCVSADDLATLIGDADAFLKYVEESTPSERHMDLDQFWDALAWLLSPSSRQKAAINHQWLLFAEGESDETPASPSAIAADDLELAVKGGSEKLHPQINFGYGPASIIDAAFVGRIADSLAAVTDEQLANNVDPPSMLGVHPDGWQHADPSVVVETLIPAFHRWRDFLTTASKAGDAVVVYFN